MFRALQLFQQILKHGAQHIKLGSAADRVFTIWYKSSLPKKSAFISGARLPPARQISTKPYSKYGDCGSKRATKAAARWGIFRVRTSVIVS